MKRACRSAPLRRAPAPMRNDSGGGPPRAATFECCVRLCGARPAGQTCLYPSAPPELPPGRPGEPRSNADQTSQALQRESTRTSVHDRSTRSSVNDHRTVVGRPMRFPVDVPGQQVAKPCNKCGQAFVAWVSLRDRVMRAALMTGPREPPLRAHSGLCLKRITSGMRALAPLVKPKPRGAGSA